MQEKLNNMQKEISFQKSEILHEKTRLEHVKPPPVDSENLNDMLSKLSQKKAELDQLLRQMELICQSL